MCLKIDVIGDNSVERQLVIGASDYENRKLCKSIENGINAGNVNMTIKEGVLIITLGEKIILHCEELSEVQLVQLGKLLLSDALEMNPWKELDVDFVGLQISKSCR